jgi:hypothetical protein
MKRRIAQGAQNEVERLAPRLAHGATAASDVMFGGGRTTGESHATWNVGLGRTGANMVRRLIKGGDDCVEFAMSPKSVEDLVKENATGAPGGWRNPTVDSTS